MMQLSAAQVTEDQLRWALAFATVECPELGVPDSLHGIVNNFSCQQCGGTGRVYALEGVRQVCPCCMGYASLFWDREGKDYRFVPSIIFDVHEVCYICGSRGEVPVEGLEAWEDGALGLPELDYILIYPEFYRDRRRLRLIYRSATMATADGHTVREALLRALACALEDEGARLAWEEA